MKIMEEKLNQVSELVENSKFIPEDIKSIVKAICRGYIRESNGKIPIEGIMNVCNTTFIKLNEDDKEFSGKNKIFANTETNYDQECNVIHIVSYLNASNYIKLIAILTHELGHVITEPKPCDINKYGVYEYVKRTTTFYNICYYDQETNELKAQKVFGFRMADGFLESICTKIFSSKQFRQELLEAGYDLKDYTYKDKRLFPSRIYDEYKACFELFDYIMDEELFNFSCHTFSTNKDLVEFINKHKLNIIFSYLDKSNDALWKLKEFEGKERTDEFDILLQDYIDKKKTSLNLAPLILEMYGKKEDDKIYQDLMDVYSSTLQEQKTLPLPNDCQSNKKR